MLTYIAPTLAEANQHEVQLTLEFGAKVRARGERIVDIED